MNPTGRAVLLLTLVTVSALVLLCGIAAGQHGEPPSRELPANSGPPSGFLVRTYPFHDENGVSKSLSCRIHEDDLRREAAGFGYPAEESLLWNEISARLGKLVEQRARLEGIRRYVTKISTSAECGQTGCKPSVKVDFPKILPANIHPSFLRFKQWLHETLEQKNEVVASEVRQYYYERGFIPREKAGDGGKDRLDLDYAGFAARGTPALEDCFRELQKAGGDLRRQAFYLGALFQDMPFQYPPRVESGLEKAEFWVPAQVMSLQKGDCDSKSVAFCSIWRNNPTPVLLVHEWSYTLGRLHTLIGLEGIPRKGDATISFGLRTFVLYDIAGGGAKPHPGIRVERRSYVRHDCIPPKGWEGAGLCPPAERPWVDFLEELLDGLLQDPG